jgi:hypothetical protein
MLSVRANIEEEIKEINKRLSQLRQKEKKLIEIVQKREHGSVLMGCLSHPELDPKAKIIDQGGYSRFVTLRSTCA